MQGTCENIEYILCIYSKLWSFHTTAYLSCKAGTLSLNKEKSDVDGQDAAITTSYRPGWP